MTDQVVAFLSDHHRSTTPPEFHVARVCNYFGPYKLLMINSGRAQGVQVGEQFTVYRGQSFVARLMIERVDVQWSAGRILEKRREPQCGDCAASHAIVLRD